MTTTSISKMNKALYNASFHLMEASKYLSNVEEFREESLKLLSMSLEMVNIIKPEQEKVSKDKMLSILDEIMGDEEEVKE
jgi:hypothetical protein